MTANTLSTVITISGLSFQPKALRFYWVGLQSSSNASSEAVNSRRGVGFASSTSSRRAVGSFSQDTAATSNAGTVVRNDAVVVTTDGAGATDGLLDLNSITSDGFTLIVDDVTPANITIFWEAWGGADISNVTVGDITEPGATGNVTYSATGFVTNGTDQVVMMAGVQSVAAINTAAAEASGMYVGFAANTNTADNIVVGGSADDASSSMDTDGWGRAGDINSMVILAGAASLTTRANLNAFSTDLFQLNWAEISSTARKSIYMAIKGGKWASGGYTIAGNSANSTATVSALPFTPVGLLLIGRMTTEQASDTTTANDRISFGSGTSTSSRRSMGTLDEDATVSSAAEIDTIIRYDQILVFPNTAGGLQSGYDIDAMNSDGFRIIVDTAGGVASEWQGYLTFGSYPPTSVPTDAVVISGQVPNALVPEFIAVPNSALVFTEYSPGLVQTLAIAIPNTALVINRQIASAMVPVQVPSTTLVITGQQPSIPSTTMGIPIPSVALNITGYIPDPYDSATYNVSWVMAVASRNVIITRNIPVSNVSTLVYVTVPNTTLIISGQIPPVTEQFKLAVPNTTLIITGQIPVSNVSTSGDTGIPVSNTTLVISGQQPALTEQFKLVIPNTALVISGQQPALTEQYRLVVPNTALVISGQQPALTEQYKLVVPNTTLVISRQQPALTEQYRLVVPNTALVISGQQPALTEQYRLIVPNNTLLISGQQPALTEQYRLVVPNTALVITGRDPLIPSADAVQVPSTTLTISGQQPVLPYIQVPNTTLVISATAPVIPVQIAVANNALVISGQQPLSTEQFKLIVANTTLVITGTTPTIPVQIAVANTTLLISGSQPAAVQFFSITVPNNALVISGQQPALTEQYKLSIPNTTLLISGQQPALTEQYKLVVPNTTLVINKLQPTLSYSNLRDTPSSNIVITGQTPRIPVQINVPETTLVITTTIPGQGIYALPNKASLVISGQQPALTEQFNLGIPNNTLVISGKQPAVTEQFKVEILNTNLVISGQQPVLTEQFKLTVANTGLVINGQFPTSNVSTHLYITVQNGTLVFSSQNPASVVSASVYPPQGAISFITYQPLVSRTERLYISPSSVEIIIEGQVPVSSTSLDKTVQPGRYQIRISGNAFILPLTSQGKITLVSIGQMFQGPIPYKLSDYYRGGTYVPNSARNAKVPADGKLKLTDYYGASRNDP
jgi:hypothetical protein